jgi:hypothetical protein
MINDDRFILGSLENWEFGVDNTGDLMELPNLKKLVARSQQMGDIHLVTADGSIDCQVVLYFNNLPMCSNTDTVTFGCKVSFWSS